MTILVGHSKEKYVNVFFEATRPNIRDLLEFQRYKYMIFLRIKLYKVKRRLGVNPDGTIDYTIDYADPSFHPKNYLVLQDANGIEDVINTSIAQIQQVIEGWMHNGSGWIIDRVVSLQINISKYQPLRGSS